MTCRPASFRAFLAAGYLQHCQLNRLLEDARCGLFDVVAVAAFDRFARSVRHMVMALDEFRHLHIDFISFREAIDTRTPMGRAMFTVIGAMAELKSALISERTTAAMEYTRRGLPSWSLHDLSYWLRRS